MLKILKAQNNYSTTASPDECNIFTFIYHPKKNGHRFLPKIATYVGAK